MLVELAAKNTVTMVAYIEGEVVCTKTKVSDARVRYLFESDRRSLFLNRFSLLSFLAIDVEMYRVLDEVLLVGDLSHKIHC